MKKALLMFALVLGCTTAFAQKVDKNEARQIKAFLSQTAEKDGTNANVLKVTDANNIASIEGITVENGHVTAIEWKDKHLAGDLDLSGFEALKKVDVSRNKLSSISVANATALSDFNASRNVLRSVDFTGCSNLVKIQIYKNRLTDVNFESLPLLQNLNVANNLFVELNVAHTRNPQLSGQPA